MSYAAAFFRERPVPESAICRACLNRTLHSHMIDATTCPAVLVLMRTRAIESNASDRRTRSLTHRLKIRRCPRFFQVYIVVSNVLLLEIHGGCLTDEFLIESCSY